MREGKSGATTYRTYVELLEPRVCLVQAPSVLRLTERQLDAISYDLTLPSLRILLRADIRGLTKGL